MNAGTCHHELPHSGSENALRGIAIKSRHHADDQFVRMALRKVTQRLTHLFHPELTHPVDDQVGATRFLCQKAGGVAAQSQRGGAGDAVVGDEHGAAGSAFGTRKDQLGVFDHGTGHLLQTGGHEFEREKTRHGRHNLHAQAR